MQEHTGFNRCLLHLLVVWALTQQCKALSSAPKQVHLPTLDPAKQYAADFRMQATSYAAYMMVRDYQTSDASHCNYPGRAADVCKWSSKDPGWERLVRAESMVAIAHQAYQAAEYDEAIIALEESLALRLFAYTDQKTLDRWQQGLVMPGTQYRHDKKAIADSLVLRSDCLVQLARANQDVAELTEATELLQLAAAELQAGQALTAASLAAISTRINGIAVLAADLLPRLSHTRLQDLLGQHGISCSASTSGSGSNATTVQPPEWCDSPGELLLHLVPLLRLPVCLLGPRGKVLTSSLGCGSTQQQQQGASSQQQQKLRKGQVPKVEPASDPFATFGTALLQKPCEVVAHYLQRMFFRLLSVVPVEYMRDLRVPCQRTDLRSRCISYLPTWVTAQAVTIDKRTGRAHVTGPSSCALDSSGRGVADPAACVAAQKAQQGSASTCQVQQQQQKQAGGLELCGFLHIRSLAPGEQLPLAGAQLSREQQALLRQASDAVHPGGSCSASGTGGSWPGCAGGASVFYYYYPDIPAVLDQVIHAQEHEESMQLLAQLDSLTNTHSLKRWLQKSNKAGDCSEAALLEGRAPDTCSLLVPSIGDCSGSHLTALSPGTPLPMLPSTQLQQARMHVLSAAAAAAPSPACGSEGGGSSSSTCKGADSAGDDSSSSRQRAQRHRGDAHDGAEDDGGGGGGGGDIVTSSSGSSRRNSNGSKRRRSKQSSDPYLDTTPYPHMYSSYARVDREIADRQLLEQMNKLERDKRHKQQDGPLIPLTLGMLVLICCLPFIASRLRRASSRQQQQQQQQQVGVLGFLLPPLRRKGSAAVAPGRPAVPVPATAAGANGGAFGVPGTCPAGAAGVWAPSASAAAPAAGLVPDAPGSAGGRADSSAVQRSAAAAVKAALSSSSDLEAMESALRQAEKAGMANTANCVRLRELLAKRKRQAQQAKRQEQMRQQEQARRGRKGRKGQQESLADAAAPDAAQQAAESAQQEQPGKAGVRRPLFCAPAWLKQVLPALGKKGNQAADGGNASSRGLGRVSDSSSTAAAAAAASAGISCSCSISSSRSASSSMISSSPSLGLAPLADLNTNTSSRGCSPATSVSCSPQSSIGATPAVQQQEHHPSDTPTQQQQPQQRERSNRRSCRGSVTVAVAPRSSKQQQHASVDADEADLADSLLAGVQDTTGHSSASSGGSSSAASSPQAAAGGGRAKKQQHKGAGREPVCSDLSSPTGTGAAGNLPIYTPPKRNSTSPAGSKAAAGGAKAAAGAGKGAKGKQQPQAVSLSAAALGCESGELFGQGTPGSVITASVGLDSSARSGSGTFGAAAVGVEPPATPAGAAAASPLRSERHHHQPQQQLPPPWQQQQQQQQQQRPAGRTSMSWLEAALPPKHRAAAVSEDGTLSNSSSCLNSPAGVQQLQQGTPPGAAGGASTQSTPSKAKLNPKAAPYNPKGYTPSPGSAAAAAGGGDWHSPAPNHTPGLILTPSPPGTGLAAASTGSSSWQQHGNPAAAAAATGVASMLQQQEGTGVARRISCNGLLEPSAVSGLSGMSGLPPPGNLAGGISAAAGLQAAHNMQQMLLQQQHYGMLPPHSAGSLQQQQAAAAAWQQQQLQEMQREEHLVAMLSALSPQDAAAAVAAMGLGGAGGSAPPPLGTAGSSGSSGVTGGGVPIDSSASSSGEYRGHMLGLGAPHGLGWSEGAGLGRPPLGAGPHTVPPGFPGSLSWQQQQHQQQQQFQMPGRISLPQDLDSQLPPGFSAETFTPGSDAAAGPYSATSSVGGVPGGAFSGPASAAATPTGSSAMLGSNSGSNPWRYVPAQGKPATPLLIVSEAAVAGPLAMQGYGGSSHGGGQPLSMSMGMSMGMDVCHAQSAMDHSLSAAAAATSANVAELVLLGSSPPQNPVAKALEGVEELFYGGGGRGGRGNGHGAAGGSGSTAAAAGGGSGSSVASGMTAADADAHAARLADEMTAGVLD